MAATAPENTLEGFRAAAAAGIEWVEFDVRLSADHVPVVIHDATLARTAGEEARIDRTTAADIARLSRAHPTPTLGETMVLLGELGLGANVEIKAVRARRAVAVAVAETLDAARRTRRNRPVPVLVSSFSTAILDNMRRLGDHWPRGLLLSRGAGDVIGLARRLGCVSIHEDHRRLTARHVADWKAAGFVVVCYTVNDAARARMLFDWGVDSVISDAPGALADCVDKGRRSGSTG
jgi:glycerophosphoryl diester phosphodiesterase